MLSTPPTAETIVHRAWTLRPASRCFSCARSVLALTFLLVLTDRSVAAEPPSDQDSAQTSAAQLAESQRQLAAKYERLEQILLRMSELSAASDPRRAALLTKAVAESKQRLIGVQFASLVDQLSKDELAKALEGQEQLDADLTDLLELLLSENRSRRLASEKARIRQYLQDLNRIINQQKSLQARTAGGSGQPNELSRQQGEIGEQTGGLADEIRRNEEPEADSPNEKDSDGKPSEPESGEKKEKGSSDAPPEDDAGKTKPEGDSKEAGEDSKSSEDGQPREGAQSDSAPEETPPDSQESGEQPGSPSEQSPSQSPSENAHPARQRLDAARRRMQQAQEKLNQAEREGAAQEQEEAIRELQQAKAELEEILRQLREEEIEQVLVALEARFVKMLQMQREVYEGTERVNKASADELSHEQEIEAGRLSSREAEIVTEADKALMLLREDGSAVAIPEALSLAREDMQDVVARLARANVGENTLATEEEIITALDEMLGAIREAMEDAEQRRQNAQEGQPGMPDDPALVDLLAELRMIRSLQLRVNTRTERYRQMISGGHAETPELLEALSRLAERQDRIYRVTTDLEAGRNR